MRIWGILLLLATSACTDSEGLPEIPPREALPLQLAVDDAYEEVLVAPRDAAGNGRLATTLHRFDDLADAEVFYQRASLLELDSFRWLYLLGRVQAAQGKDALAVATLRRALSKQPGYVPARLLLAGLAVRMGNLVDSGATYRELLDAGEAVALAQFGLGQVQLRQGDPWAAAGSFQRACDAFPEFGPAHYALGVVSLQLGRGVEAREHLTLAERHKLRTPPFEDPLIEEVHGRQHQAWQFARTGYEHELAGRMEEAVAAYNQALRIDPRLAEAHARMILVQSSLGEEDRAIEHYHTALALDPNLADTHANYGLLLLRSERFTEARAAFDQAAAINPFQPEALASLALMFDKDGDRAAAERNYVSALAVRPGYREARLNYGILLVDLKRHEDASAQFEAAVETEDENTPSYLYEIARQYARMGDRAKSQASLERARKLAVAHGQLALLDRIEKGR